MQEGLRAQENAEGFEDSKECRNVQGLRKIQEILRAQKNDESFEGSKEFRKV